MPSERRATSAASGNVDFWEHMIRDETDYARHIAYCYINPVKHGLVTRVRDWPHSSFHRDVARGIVPLDWAGDVATDGEFGEVL